MTTSRSCLARRLGGRSGPGAGPGGGAAFAHGPAGDLADLVGGERDALRREHRLHGADVVTGATAVTAGYRRACALGAAGDVRCWGESTPERPLGVGDPTRDSTFPARSVRSGPDAGALSGVGAVTTSRNTLCATGDAGVRCWGEVNELDAVAPWPAR